LKNNGFCRKEGVEFENRGGLVGVTVADMGYWRFVERHEKEGREELLAVVGD
jgi:hypothetical protein